MYFSTNALAVQQEIYPLLICKKRQAVRLKMCGGESSNKKDGPREKSPGSVSSNQNQSPVYGSTWADLHRPDSRLERFCVLLILVSVLLTRYHKEKLFCSIDLKKYRLCKINHKKKTGPDENHRSTVSTNQNQSPFLWHLLGQLIAACFPQNATL
jgi:hypothetical protein